MFTVTGFDNSEVVLAAVHIILDLQNKVVANVKSGQMSTEFKLSSPFRPQAEAVFLPGFIYHKVSLSLASSLNSEKYPNF